MLNWNAQLLVAMKVLKLAMEKLYVKQGAVSFGRFDGFPCNLLALSWVWMSIRWCV